MYTISQQKQSIYIFMEQCIQFLGSAWNSIDQSLKSDLIQSQKKNLI